MTRQRRERTIEPRSTRWCCGGAQMLLCLPARETTSAPFMPTVHSFACPASATRWASFPIPRLAASSTYDCRLQPGEATPRLATLFPMLLSPSRPLLSSNCGGRPAASSLLSAKEVQPGVLVFRLRDQTPSATGGPRHPAGASGLQPRLHRELQPPRRSPHPDKTPPLGMPHS